MDYAEYRSDLLNNLRSDAQINGTDTEDEFIRHAFDVLSDFNEVSDPQLVNMWDKTVGGNRKIRLNGYAFDEADSSLILFITDFQDSLTPDNLTMSRVDELYWRLYYYLDEVCNGKIEEYFDESDPDGILKLSRLIRKRIKGTDTEEQFLKIRFFILTNKELDKKLLDANLLETTVRSTKSKTRRTVKSTKKIKKPDFEGVPLEINLWYLERFYEMESSNSDDPIYIDIPAYYDNLGYKGIPCIKGNIGENLDYEAYIAIIPGKLLAQIYIDYGSKVLEGNVRAFLGTRSSKGVNSGIKKTINNDGKNFFTYNNGIATTASDVTIEIIDGEQYITNITDLQIINGGQTTATLAEAVIRKTNESLEGIFVPMKLTVIRDRETELEDGTRFYDKMVSDIARYANSQNKVTAADFFSNDPFHIRMEKMSKRYLAPPAKYNVPTGWYYERSRKKYEQEEMKLSAADKKKFEIKFPKKQKITKEDLGKYITTVDSCRPDIVSRGKNWVIKQFGETIRNEYNKDKAAFNEFYFHKCIAYAIIYITVDNYLEENKSSIRKPTDFWYKAGGYKGNIVPYSISKIITSIPEGYTLDWERIWRNQSISPAFMAEVERITKLTNDYICDSHGVIVTEYCKKESTWNNYRDNYKYDLSIDFIRELVSVSSVASQEKAARKEEKSNEEYGQIMQMISLGTAYWTKVRAEAESRHMLSYQEKTNLDKMIGMVTKGVIPYSPSGRLPRITIEIINTAKSVVEKLETEGIQV